jgi:hypothetical protein
MAEVRRLAEMHWPEVRASLDAGTNVVCETQDQDSNRERQLAMCAAIVS